MTDAEKLELARNRLARLRTSRECAWSNGDETAVRGIDTEIAETEARIALLEGRP